MTEKRFHSPFSHRETTLTSLPTITSWRPLKTRLNGIRCASPTPTPPLNDTQRALYWPLRWHDDWLEPGEFR